MPMVTETMKKSFASGDAFPLNRDAIISLREVSFSYAEAPILHEISFDVFRGGTKVILGASGSGKTTLLRLILGLIKPNSGTICIDGQDITRMEEKQLNQVRMKMGVLFQEGALFDSLNVRNNVAYRLIEARKFSAQEIDQRVLELLDMVELGDIRHLKPEELSGGMKRRVAIARALAGNPQILLYDEPTTGLDPIVCESLCNLLIKLRDQHGVSSIIITHDLASALRVANRFVLLRHGKVLFEGPTEELLQQRDGYIEKFLNFMRNYHYGL